MPIYALADDAPDIHPTAYVHPDAVVIGSVTIGAESTIWPGAILRGDYGYIRVGNRTSIQDGAVIHATAESPTYIGDDCVIGHLAHLEGCVVHGPSLIGSSAVLLHRALIERDSVVGAHALIPEGMQVLTGTMALGIPARLRDSTVDLKFVAETVELYRANGRRYHRDLRPIHQGSRPMKESTV